MTRLLRDADVRSLVSFPEAIDVVARGIVEAAALEDGAASARSTALVGGGWLRVMSGALPSENVLGFKAFHLVPGAGVRYLCALYRLDDGEPLALIDANHLTRARTAAAAAAAAARFWGDASLRLGIIGTGSLARECLRALASVCRVQSAAVYSRSGENRERFVADLEAELGLDLQVAASAGAATRAADMILCATQTAGAIALRAADAGEARYISSISSTLPMQRELDERVIAGAAVVVIDTPDALRESGDLLAAAQAGLDQRRVVGLGDFLARRDAHSDAPVVYKSIGSVEQDLALAAALWRAAERSGVGDRIAAIEAPAV